MDEFQGRKLRPQKRQEINAARGFPAPRLVFSDRGRSVARQRRLKFRLHLFCVQLWQSPAAAVSANKAINPFVMKRIELERVLGRIEITTEIIAGVTGKPRHDPGPGTTSRAN